VPNPLAERHVATIDPIPRLQKLRMRASGSMPKTLAVTIPVDRRIPIKKMHVRLVGARSGEEVDANVSMGSKGKIVVAVDPKIGEPVQVWMVVRS
jgi:hypothetical protein